MSAKSKSKTARKKAVKTVPSIRKEFGGLVELIQGEFPAPLYEKFFGPFNGRKASASRPEFHPPPAGVIEHTSAEYEPITDGGIVELADGRLMLAQGNGINFPSSVSLVPSFGVLSLETCGKMASAYLGGISPLGRPVMIVSNRGTRIDKLVAMNDVGEL